MTYPPKLYNTIIWNEEIGDCLFFHFENFKEPPTVIYSSPNSSDFEELGAEHWTHFIMMNMNHIFMQAKSLHRTLEAIKVKDFGFDCPECKEPHHGFTSPPIGSQFPCDNCKTIILIPEDVKVEM